MRACRWVWVCVPLDHPLTGNRVGTTEPDERGNGADVVSVVPLGGYCRSRQRTTRTAKSTRPGAEWQDNGTPARTFLAPGIARDGTTRR